MTSGSLTARTGGVSIRTIDGLAHLAQDLLEPLQADLLSLERFKQILRQMSQTVDMVLIDTPPVLAVSDPLVIAPQLDGMVFVVQANRTRTDGVRRAISQLRQGNARILGVVINRQKGRGADYYYYGYGAYYGPDESRKGKPNGHSATNGHHPHAEEPTEEGSESGRRLRFDPVDGSATWYDQTPLLNRKVRTIRPIPARAWYRPYAGPRMK